VAAAGPNVIEEDAVAKVLTKPIQRNAWSSTVYASFRAGRVVMFYPIE
jgi:hypothetical protein